MKDTLNPGSLLQSKRECHPGAFLLGGSILGKTHLSLFENENIIILVRTLNQKLDVLLLFTVF